MVQHSILTLCTLYTCWKYERWKEFKWKTFETDLNLPDQPLFSIRMDILVEFRKDS